MLLLSIPLGIILALSINVFIGAYFIYLYLWHARKKIYLYWSVSCFFTAIGAAGITADYSDTTNAPTIFNLVRLSASYFLVLGLYKFIRLVHTQTRANTPVYIIACLFIICPFAELQWNDIAASVFISINLFHCAHILRYAPLTFRYAVRIFQVIFILHATILLVQAGLDFCQINQPITPNLYELLSISLMNHLLFTITTALFLLVLQLCQNTNNSHRVISSLL
jgi:hypothetical protein